MPTLTINTTTTQATRIAVAYGSKLGLNRNATAAEIKQAVISEIRQVVRSYEHRIQAEAITVDTLDPT